MKTKLCRPILIECKESPLRLSHNKLIEAGAKSNTAKEYWQQGMYTEEEVKLLCAKLLDNFTNPEYLKTVVKDFPNWFEQNKKK